MIREEGKVTCPDCGWRGREEDAEQKAELALDRTVFVEICPRCRSRVVDVCDEVGCWKHARITTPGRYTCPDHRPIIPPLSIGGLW